jgi:hypothetical protein
VYTTLITVLGDTLPVVELVGVASAEQRANDMKEKFGSVKIS